MRGWTLCDNQTPDSERQVIVARPDAADTEAANWLTPENVWVNSQTGEQIWPTLWQEMPANPMITE